jgi:FKBP-type peptidyl-prolyl cis-trans isomerase (trigger factor)
LEKEKILNYELQIDCLPSVALKSFDKFKATSFKVKIEDKIIEEKLKEIANQNKQFEDKNENEKATMEIKLLLIILLQLMVINLKEVREKVYS